MWDMQLDWYHFNVFTLAVDVLVTAFSWLTLFIALEERQGKRNKKGEK